MITRMTLMIFGIALAAAACTPAGEPIEPDDPAPVERTIAPTQAMLAAALAGDPHGMQQSVALSGCPAPSTCPSSYGACTGWSAPAECSFTCNASPVCSCPIVIEHPDVPPEPCEPDPSIQLGRRTFSSFRVCFNPQQQACTEWKQSLQLFCGC